VRSAWRAAEIRAAEQQLMARLAPGTLMQRAAAGLARRAAVILQARGGVYGARVLLLVGSGDNGGDALYAGARLAARGAAVAALPVVSNRLHPAGLAALLAAGGRVVPTLPGGADLVIDGIVGIGARGPLREPAPTFVDALGSLAGRDGARASVVSVDVPSGVDVDTGAVPGPAVRADVTVTFGLYKGCLLVGPAAARAGQVELIQIGLPQPPSPPLVAAPDAADVAGWWPSHGADSDKYRRGVAGVATGGARYPGAALLSVAGALAGPAGLVRYAGSAAAEVVRAYPPVVACPDVASAGRVQAWLFGCGSGLDDPAAALLRAVLDSDVPVLLDADALTLLSTLPWAASLVRRRAAPTVVTPHDREFTRLAGAAPGPDRVGSARRLADQLGATVLLKGDRTIVAGPDPATPAWVNPTGTPHLASAGTGDVLAGMVVSLLAAGVPVARAAIAGAFVHGLAARTAAAQLSATAAPSATAATNGCVAALPVTAAQVAAALPAAVATLIER
jgi:hydroxyethylthiazole kinase-like uncharacterized protein yjeF